MTDPSTSAPLSPFEGKPVLGVGIEIPGAAGGLRDALTVDPIEKHYDDEVVVVLVTKVGKLRFDPVKDTDGWKRVHVLDVQEGMIVDKDLVAEHLARQRARLAELKLAQESEERGGVITFPTDEELHDAHVAGEHAEALIEGCVDCDLELQAVASEAREDAAATVTDAADALAAGDPDKAAEILDGPPAPDSAGLAAGLAKATADAAAAGEPKRPNPAKATADKKAAAKKAPAKKAAARKRPGATS